MTMVIALTPVIVVITSVLILWTTSPTTFCQSADFFVTTFTPPLTRRWRVTDHTTTTSALYGLGPSSSLNESFNDYNGNGRDKQRSGVKRPTTKKRRFLQQAHPVQNTISSTSTQKQQKQDTDAFDAVVISTSNIPTASKNDRSANARISPPLRTNKSIEELEAILEKRWGTTTTSVSTTSKLPKKGMNSMANRVLDPWAEDDETVGKKPSSTNSKKSRDKQYYDDANQTHPVPPQLSQRIGQKRRSNREEFMLNKVRISQERLNSENKNNNNYYDSEIPIVNVSRRDYYDEDDEGYEEEEEEEEDRMFVTVTKKRKRNNVDENGILKSDKQVIPSVSSAMSGGGIFFSNPTPRIESAGLQTLQKPPQQDRAPLPLSLGNDRNKNSRVSTTVHKTNKIEKEKVDDDVVREGKRLKRKESVSLPLLDEDGTEMFLTLEQADKIVKNILSSVSSSIPIVEPDDELGRVVDADSNYSNIKKKENTDWEDIGVTDESLLSNLRSNDKLCCPYPLAAQDRACPPIVAGNDVLLSTHTGSGKTLAFLAPIAQSLLINNISNRGGGGVFPKVIVVAPGRELASQIVSVAQTLFSGTGLTATLAIGGTPYSRNVEKLRKTKPDVVVGTPGRIAELVIGRPEDNGGKLKISGLQTIVLDEFDALLQYDAHVEPTMAILKAVDRQHGHSLQRIFCSATASDMLGGRSLKDGLDIETFLRPGYAHASVDDDDVLVTSGVRTDGGSGSNISTSVRVSKTTIHGTLHVPSRRLALEAVRKVLNTNPAPQQALIFVDSSRRVDIVIKKLAEMDIVAAPLHGGTNSGKSDRAEVNKALREGFVGIVVATEIAARGIDAPYLTHVINLDLPTDASHYAHRAGRCGRGGRPGVAISITCDVREKGVPKRFADELGITMYNVEAKEGKLRIIQ